MIEFKLGFAKNNVYLIPYNDHSLFHKGDGRFTMQLIRFNNYLLPYIHNGFFKGVKTEIFCGRIENIDSTDDLKKILKKVSKEISSIKTGDSFYEFNLKARKFFTYFDYSYRLKKYINYVGFNKNIGIESLNGNCKVLSFDKLLDEPNGAFKCVIKSKFISSIGIIYFDVLCVSPLVVQADLNNSLEIPNHLLCNHNDVNRLISFIESEISILKFSSLDELRLKLSVFSNEFLDTENQIAIPLVGESIHSFKIKDNEVSKVIESWSKPIAL